MTFNEWFVSVRRYHPSGMMTRDEVISYLDLNPCESDEIISDLVLSGRLKKIPSIGSAPNGKIYFDVSDVVSVFDDFCFNSEWGF